MTWKLALLNVKKRWQDYTVLMLGLVISVAIFYMFQTLSLNISFLKEAIPTVAMVGFIFQLGAIMLGIITVVYIFYANSFLLSMRKKEYGMYMMFGAKKAKIKQMMTIETLSIGSLALLLGMLVGMGFASIMSRVLMKTLDLSSNAYSAYSVKAVVVTVIFFLILFSITAVVNNLKFAKTKLLDLLNEEGTSEKYRPNKLKTIGLTVLSLVLLGVGYLSMAFIEKTAQMGLIIAMLTITLGTFVFYQALFPTVINFLKNSRFAQKNLRMFTLSQLSFKASSISRVLGMVTMMLALSLGAITVGFAFNNQIDRMVEQYPYDVISVNPTPEITEQMSKLSVKEERVLQTKEQGDTTYYLYDDLKKTPILIDKDETSNGMGGINSAQEKIPFDTFKSGDEYTYGNTPMRVMNAFSDIKNPYAGQILGDHSIKIVDQATFDAIKSPVLVNHSLVINDFKGNLPILKKIDALENARKTETEADAASKYQTYSLISSMMSGFMFMGAFLGIAFLAMLASCLMFKILSGAHADKTRYDMLHKIGVKNSLLKRSIRQEIGVLFLVPGILGAIHVLFGLKLFEMLLQNPYGYLAVPFIIFAVVYFVYYLFTVVLYKNIVLKKSEA